MVTESAPNRDHGSTPEDPVREYLLGLRAGDPEALDRLYTLLYEELRELARRVRRGSATPTLNTTALLHEAYLKLIPKRGLAVEDRGHFRSLVARAMRQVLVDAARERAAEKRGGGLVRVTMADPAEEQPMEPADALALDRALTELATLDPRRAQVVELRFFGGLDVEQTAEAMGISTATVKRDWRLARAWLSQAVG